MAIAVGVEVVVVEGKQSAIEDRLSTGVLEGYMNELQRPRRAPLEGVN